MFFPGINLYELISVKLIIAHTIRRNYLFSLTYTIKNIKKNVLKKIKKQNYNKHTNKQTIKYKTRKQTEYYFRQSQLLTVYR